MNPHDHDEHWMRHALTLAQKAADAGEVPVGAVVVVRDDNGDERIVGEGWNQPIGSHDPTAHAEMMALRQAAQTLQNYRIPHAEIFVTLEPCTMCTGAMVHARIARLIYGTTEPKAGAVISQNQLLDHPAMNTRVEVTGGVLAEPCARMLQDFFARRRQQHRDRREQREQREQKPQS